MLVDTDQQQALHVLLLENQRLLTENNQLLKKMHKRSSVTFWINIVWFMILLGAPFVLYFYVIEPYFKPIAEAIQSLQGSLQDVPGWKQFYSAIGGGSE